MDDDDEVYTLPLGDLAVVTGHTACADYRGMSRQEAVRYLVIHQRVVEAVLAGYPVLPVKFGTVLADEASILRLLAQGKPLFQAALAKIARQVQMEVVVLWNPQTVFCQIGQEEPIARLKAELMGRPAQETSSERVALGQMVMASLDRRRAAIREHVLPALQEVASDLVMNPLMDESMVLNMALLMGRIASETLSGKLEALDQAFGGKLTLRCVGPLPPYSFATVEVAMPSFEAIDAARRSLGLDAVATAREIQKAYHQQAEQAHPDHNSHDVKAETRMTALTQAYHLLMSFSTSQALYQADACSFSREAVEQAFLIGIRRQESPV